MSIESEIKVLKGNKVYRFSDLILMKGLTWREHRDLVIENPKYNGSILQSYLIEKKSELDFDTLANVVFRRSREFASPKYDELVIHMRTGDVMDSEDYERLQNRSFDFYSNIYEETEVDLSLINKVTLVTAMHFGSCDKENRFFYSEKAYQKSLELVRILEQKTNEKGFELNLMSNEDIDLDICYMARAQFFIFGFSQMSDIISSISKRNPLGRHVSFSKHFEEYQAEEVRQHRKRILEKEN